MRIIKNGHIPTKRQLRDMVEHKKTCKNCGCVFAYTNHDRKATHNMDLDYYLYVNCPSCEDLIFTSMLDKKIK